MRKMFFVMFILVLASIGLAAEKAVTVSSTVNPSTVSPGGSGYIQMTIQNSGTLFMDKVRVYVLSSSLSMESTFIDLGTLDTLKTTDAVFKFSVPGSAKPDFYNVEFKIEYCYSNDCEESIHYTVVNVREANALGLVSVIPDSLKIGGNETVVFTLKNNGGAINNLVLTWSEASNMILPLGSDNRKFVSSIGAGKTADIMVNILANPAASIGVYPVSINIAYDDPTGTRQSVNSTVGLKVIGDFDFIDILDSQGVIAPGITGYADIKVINRGDQEAKFLTLSVSSEAFYADPLYVYIGNLKQDDYSTEKIWLTAKNVAPGTYPISVDLSYKDAYGNSYQDSQPLNIRIYTLEQYAASQPQPSYDWLFFLIFIVAVYIFYKKYWKKRKK